MFLLSFIQTNHLLAVLFFLIICSTPTLVKAGFEDEIDYLPWAKSYGLRVTENGQLPDVQGPYAAIKNFQSGGLAKIFSIARPDFNSTTQADEKPSFSVFRNGKLAFILFEKEIDSQGRRYKLVTLGNELLEGKVSESQRRELTEFLRALLKNYNFPLGGVEAINGIHILNVIVPSMGLPEKEKTLPLLKLDSVYSDPSGGATDMDYSYRLLAQVDREIGENPKIRNVLVLGSGIGYEAVYLLRMFSSIQVDAVDINELAVMNTQMNFDLHGLNSRGRVYQTDLFAGLTERYDLILFVAPRPFFKESRDPILTRRFENMNKAVFDHNAQLLIRLMNSFPQHLKKDGVFYIMSDAAYFPKIMNDLGYFYESRYEALWGGVAPGQGRFGIFRVRHPKITDSTYSSIAPAEPKPPQCNGL